jgi:hypothetical protein
MSRVDIARQFIRNKTLVFNNLAFAGNTFVTSFFYERDANKVEKVEIMMENKSVD